VKQFLNIFETARDFINIKLTLAGTVHPAGHGDLAESQGQQSGAVVKNEGDGSHP